MVSCGHRYAALRVTLDANRGLTFSALTRSVVCDGFDGERWQYTHRAEIARARESGTTHIYTHLLEELESVRDRRVGGIDCK